MLLAVPGAIAGGLFFQWLMGLKLSVTVWVGYIACFGMATSTGIIMLVYLREAVARGGGLTGCPWPTFVRPCWMGRSIASDPSCSPKGLSCSGWRRCSGPAALRRR